MTTLHRDLFKQALQEKLAEVQKHSFVPMGPAAAKTGQQAAGPGGAPVDPMAAGGAPMDPAAMGMPPGGDPMGAPPMPGGDPAAMGMPPGGDPAAMGMDPAAGGLPPLPPEGELPPLPEEGGAGGGEGVTSEDAETIQKITDRTMDIVRQTLEMVGKAKPQEAPKEEEPAEQQPPEPEAQPGPITGQPGFDPNMISGPLKLATLKHLLAKNKQSKEGQVQEKPEPKPRPKPITQGSLRQEGIANVMAARTPAQVAAAKSTVPEPVKTPVRSGWDYLSLSPTYTTQRGYYPGAEKAPSRARLAAIAAKAKKRMQERKLQRQKALRQPQQ